ncbi:hypothetical protein LCGC14_0789950 [marine sediment metagenome]|uniref:Uncharacterized protein n=1 Tax=marine sediment metagenome TaxID=412755 RepID=A0A0F9PT04_9ZZZZ
MTRYRRWPSYQAWRRKAILPTLEKADLKERQVEVLAFGLAQALGSMGAWPEKFE